MAQDNFKGEFVRNENSYCVNCKKDSEHKVESGTQNKGASERVINIKKYTCNDCGNFKYTLLDEVDNPELITKRNKTQYHKRVFGYLMLLGYFGVVAIASVLNFFEYKIFKRVKR